MPKKLAVYLDHCEEFVNTLNKEQQTELWEEFREK